MKKITLFLAIISFSWQISAQVDFQESFDASTTLPTNWTESGGKTISPVDACAGNSIRDNLFNLSTTGTLTTPNLIGASNATNLTISFDYKIEDWNSTTATAAGWGTIELQWSVDDGATWTTQLTIDDTNHIVANTCTNMSVIVPATNLPMGSDVKIQFVFTHITGDYDIYIDNFLAQQVVPCLSSNALTATGITTTTANLGWTSADILFDVEYGVAPYTATGIATNSGVANPLTLTGLTAQTTYDYYVRTDCTSSGNGTSNWSGPFSFTTACTAMTTPYLENVEAHALTVISDITNCWSSNPATIGTAFRWDVGTLTTFSPNTGPTGAKSGANYFYTEASSGLAGDIAELTSPLIDVSGLTAPAISFYYHMHGSDMGVLSVDVYDGAAWNNNIITITGQQQTATTDPWLQSITDISGLTITGPIQLRFTGVRGVGFTGDISLDDIEIVEAPVCSAPIILTATDITATTANLGWTSTGSSTWDVEYGVAPYTATGIPTITNTTNNPEGVTGLSPNTTYEYYVRSDCGGSGTSTWSGPFSFTTLCVTDSAPYLEDFSAFLPACWAEGNNTDVATGPNNSNGAWEQDDFINDLAHTNGKSARINLFNLGDSDWLVSPTFDLSAGGMAMSIEVAVTAFTGTAAHVMGTDDEVQILISDDAGATWTVLETFNQANSPSNIGELKVYDLATHTSATTKFAFWGTEGIVDDVGDYNFYVDNFIVDTLTVLSVRDLQQLEGFKYYPNPVTNTLNISAQSNIDNLQIVNMLGQVVKTAQPNLQTYSLDINNLATGVYFIRATVNNVEGTFRIVKQ